MKEQNIYDYYAFGFNYKSLFVTLKGKTNDFSVKALESYLGYIKDMELVVTEQVIRKLPEIKDQLAALDPELVIDEALANKIGKIVESADGALDAELQLKKVLVVTPKRFNIDMLLKNPSSLLAMGSWEELPDIAQHDFSSATKAVAMGLPTATAFHLMRCVEEMVKQLYFSFVKTNRIKKPMWGPMVNKLQTKNNPKPSVELLETLDMIRRNFRNPTQHPDKIYSEDEAQDLLNSSIVAINMIASVLKARQ
ncbi:HEPN domain-containing protein [Vibrio sp. SCSIO 43133]|uniref:HEPN domain-containing protein n=1 Tax=Vibrio sp. SCSIO 43133 TaxID=2802577 RepID=UPI0020759AAC|nr:HEPN domain-containing protein [Vibrio sp. SCSIO 43133]USE03347.1 HEPN domain-containing protein [Vibrio sp. SCSIO 43133]